MSRFRPSKYKTVPLLNTSALPDMVFTLLFFFMIVTHIRTVPVMTQFELPTSKTLQKLEERSLLLYVMVGKDPHQIQFNSEFIDLTSLPEHLQAWKDSIDPDERGEMTAVLKIDKNTPMHIVYQIKRCLREEKILTLHYSGVKLTS